MIYKYLILTHGIDSIGGGQLYVASKVEYLKSIGWNINVFAYSEGSIMISSLNSFQGNMIPELTVHPGCFNNKVRNAILERLSMGCDSDTIIESNSTTLSLWGEILAERLNCKHLLYNINETVKCSQDYLDYYRFKLYRNELKGITEQSISDFFAGLISIQPTQKYCLKAIYDFKQVDDYDYKISDSLDPSLPTIGVVGRLDKPFVLSITKDLVSYLKNTDKHFNIVYIGGAAAGSNIEEELKNKLSVLSNINLILAGYLFPMPSNLIHSLDVCISSSGAVKSIARENILTIAIDANDLKPIGIFGVTTFNMLFRDTEVAETLEKILDDVLFKKKYSNLDIMFLEEKQEYSDKWKPHLQFIYDSCQVKDYFVRFPKPSFLKKILIQLFGISFYKNVWNFLKQFLKY